MGTWSLGRVLIDFPKGHPQNGLEVLMRRKRVGEALIGLNRPSRPTVSDEDFEAMTLEERAEHLTAMTEERISEFAKLLISWNLTEAEYDEHGNKVGEKPIPANADGIKELDDVTFTELSIAYSQATTRVAPPLPQPSDGGEPSEVALTLPQEPL